MKSHMMILVVSLVLVVESFAQQTCHSLNNQPYRGFGSLSLYQPSAAPLADDFVPGCTATMIFMLVRNGAHTPNGDDILDFNNRLPALRDRILRSPNTLLCRQDLDELRDWNLRVNASNADQLTQLGANDAYNLAQRLRGKYSGLLNQRYSDDKFVIRHAYSSDRNTATAFAEGLGFNASHARGPTPQERDLLLQFSASCEADDNDADDVLEEFFEMQEVKTMIAGITARLGLEQDSLSFEDINAMYRMCASDFALSGRSPWCAAFTTQDLLLLELKEDVVSAELYGYEDDINKLETCVLAKDLVDRLNDGAQQLSQFPPAVLYFANTQAVLPFMTRLGLFEDEEELEFDDDASVQSFANRKWRTSFINPFMSNVALVLYQCLSDNGPTYQVKALVNEVAVKLPECPATVCPLENLMEMIEDFAEDCSYEELCDGVSAVTVSYAAISLMTLLSVVYTFMFS